MSKARKPTVKAPGLTLLHSSVSNIAKEYDRRI